MTRALPFFLLPALVATAAAGASPPWSAPVQLSAEARAIGPDLAVSASGHALVVWDREEGGECAASPASLGCIHIVTARSRSGPGAAWGPELELNRPGVGAEPRAAVNDAGAEAVVWIHDIGDNRVVQATYRRSAADAFPEPNDLSKIVRRVAEHEVALDATGNAAAVWMETRLDGTSAVVAETRPAATGVWGPPGTLSTPGTHVSAGPRVAVDGYGEIFAIWIEDGVVRVALGWASTSTGAWLSPSALSTGSGHAAGDVAIAAASSGGAAEAAWTWQPAAPGAPWRLATATRGAGGAWLAPVDVAPVDAPDPVHPRLAVASPGSVVALWLDGSRTSRLRASTREAGSSAWAPPALVAERAAGPQLTVDVGGNAVALWADASTGAIEAAVRPLAAGAWQPAAVLASAAGSDADVGSDAPARAIGVWDRGAGDAAVVESSALAGLDELSLANARRPAIRGVVRVGRTVTCDRGSWEGTVPIRYSYAWARNARAVRDAFGSRYRVRRADAGKTLQCHVRATNVARSMTVSSPPVRVRR